MACKQQRYLDIWQFKEINAPMEGKYLPINAKIIWVPGLLRLQVYLFYVVVVLDHAKLKVTDHGINEAHRYNPYTNPQNQKSYCI